MELGGSPREALVRGKAWVRLRCVLQEVVSRGTPGKSSCWRGVAGGRPGLQTSSSAWGSFKSPPPDPHQDKWPPCQAAPLSDRRDDWG